jgi:hypothetical protein
MYQLDAAARETIANALRELGTDEDRPIHIDGDVWVGHDTNGRYENMHPAVAHRRVVNTVLDHELVQIAMREQDSTWETLKWLLANVKVPKSSHIPEEHRHVVEMAQAAVEWNAVK